MFTLQDECYYLLIVLWDVNVVGLWHTLNIPGVLQIYECSYTSLNMNYSLRLRML